MSKKYFVIDFKKIKTQAQFNNWLLGHNERKYKLQRENVNLERTENNIILQALKYRSAADFIEQKKQEIKKINEINKKKRAELVKKLVAEGMDKKEAQKLAREKFPKRRAPSDKQAIGFALVVDCSVMDGWTEENYINYLMEALEYLKKRFKDIELLNAVIHLDESKPHLHVAFAYWSPAEKRFIEKRLFDKGVTDLNKLLNDFEKEVGRKFGLVRGTGKEINKPFKRELAKHVETIETRKLIFFKEQHKVVRTKNVVKAIKELDNKHKKALYENENLKQKLTESNNKIKELQKYKDDFLSAVERIKQLEQELQSKEKELQEKDKKIDSLKKQLQSKENEISQLEQALLQEREKRLGIQSQFPQKTIKRIREDYGISR
jgi:hypothetical protein